MALHRHLGPALISISLLAACGDDSTTAQLPQHPTLVAVGPAEFLGKTPCRVGEGSAQLYSTTLYDLSERGSDHERGFPLPSSELVPCTQSAGFSLVVAEHWYAAEVRVFDRLGLEPAAPGSPEVVDASTDRTVAPRWSTSCGFPELDGELDSDDFAASGAARAVPRLTRTVRGCAALLDQAPAGETGITLDLEALAGDRGCGDGPEEIERYEVALDDRVLALDCGEQARFSELEAPAAFRLDVLAFVSGQSEPRFGAACRARTRTGIFVAAECDPLSDSASVEVDVPALLREAGSSCGDPVTRVAAELDDGNGLRVLPADPTQCNRRVRFDDLAPGPYTVVVTTELGDGAAGPAFTCSAEARLGQIETAACRLDD